MTDKKKGTGMNILVTDDERAMVNELKDQLGLNNNKAAIMVAVKAALKRARRA